MVLWHTEVVIETHLQRPGDGQLVPVRAIAQMPFADGRRTIALRFEQRGYVHPVRLEVVVVALPVQPPRITSREQSIARRRTDRRGRMRVGEPHAVAGEPVKVRRLDLRRTVASDVAVAKIIREDDDDVRLAGFTISGVQRGQRRQQQGGEEPQGWVSWLFLVLSFVSSVPVVRNHRSEMRQSMDISRSVCACGRSLTLRRMQESDRRGKGSVPQETPGCAAGRADGAQAGAH